MKKRSIKIKSKIHLEKTYQGLSRDEQAEVRQAIARQCEVLADVLMGIKPVRAILTFLHTRNRRRDKSDRSS